MKDINAEISKHRRKLDWHCEKQKDLAQEVAIRLTAIADRLREHAGRMQNGETVSFALNSLRRDADSWLRSVEGYELEIAAATGVIDVLTHLAAE